MNGASDNGLAIEIRDLRKSFRLYENPTDVLWELFFGQRRSRESMALNGVTLSVRRGETLGIIGRNGAGKSTLLKIIAGTLVPTAGTVAVHGRIAAILELGSGFHLDFSGRENIYMGGMVLGLSRAEIDERFDAIVEFSELESHIDQPLRTYSTGMQARLSFSVATSVDPDIMIVDEALSVGDARFQLKCFARFDEMRRAGKTVLLVSHNMVTVTGLCDRAVLLEDGRILEVGEPKYVDMVYHRLLFGGGVGPDTRESPPREEPIPEAAQSPSATARRFGSGAATILECGLRGPDGVETTRVASGERCTLYMTFVAKQALASVVAGFLVRTPKGVDLFGVDTATDPAARITDCLPGERVHVELDLSMWLASGEYFVVFALAGGDGQKLDARYDDLLFRVTGTDRIYTTSIVNLDHRLTHRASVPAHAPDLAAEGG